MSVSQTNDSHHQPCGILVSIIKLRQLQHLSKVWVGHSLTL